MKAIAVFQNDIRMIDIPEPRLTKPNQIKIKILDVGICGTDREICHCRYGSRPKGSPYLIIGHEACGQIVELGQNVERFKLGDIVTLTLRRQCNDDACLPCINGHPDYCTTGGFLECGIKGMHGFLTQYVIGEEQYTVLVPKALKDVGVFIEPMSVVIKAMKQALRIEENCARKKQQNALVMGSGTMGLLGAMYLQYKGFNTFVYSHPTADSIQSNIVQKIGATYLPAGDFSLDALNIGDIELIFDTGHSTLIPTLIDILGTNGVLILIGISEGDEYINADFSTIMNDLVLQNQTIIGSVNASYQDFEEAIRCLEIFDRQWKIPFYQMITRHYSFFEFENIINDLMKKNGIKSVINVGELTNGSVR